MDWPPKSKVCTAGSAAYSRIPTFDPGLGLVLRGRHGGGTGEELHFNRYRRTTLEPAWTARFPWRQDYLRYCGEYEPACLAAATWGKRWTNPSCERLFGDGGAPGDLAGAGAPRWKQRALYDAMKDAAAAAGVLRLARIATVDLIGNVPLGDALEARVDVKPEAVAKLVRGRLAG